MFSFSAPRKSRRPSLTPMIDVVFLLLVFFMLAARFGQDFSISLSAAGGQTPANETPRLVTVSGAEIALNGVAESLENLPAALDALAVGPSVPVFLQPRGATTLQDLVAVLDALRAAGDYTVIVVAAP